MKRRSFLKSSSIVMAGAGGIKTSLGINQPVIDLTGVTLSLNAYSFNKPLLAGEMSLPELFQFAGKTGFAGVDLTAYYIPGYPEVPSDEVLFDIKKSAFLLGVAISGTGVRNDFTLQDPLEHKNHMDLVKQWIIAASKLGAPQVRIFAGRGSEEDVSRKEVKNQVIEAFQECADFASQQGVMVVFQNHYDYIQSTDEIIELVTGVQSDWFGLMLDIGSVEGPDPYLGIEQLIPYTVTWQVKENVRSAGGTSPTDFPRLLKIMHDQQYRGYFPLETLGEGDPYEKVRKLYSIVTESAAF